MAQIPAKLVDGELIPMSLSRGKHGAIAKFLERAFDDAITSLRTPWTAQKFSVGVRSPRGDRWQTSRIPDVTVLLINRKRSLKDQPSSKTNYPQSWS